MSGRSYIYPEETEPFSIVWFWNGLEEDYYNSIKHIFEKRPYKLYCLHLWLKRYSVAMRSYHESLFPTVIAGATYCLVMFALASVVSVSSIS